MSTKPLDLKNALVELLRGLFFKWKTITVCFVTGLMVGLAIIVVMPQVYKSSQVAYYKLDRDQLDFNVTEIYSTLGKETKDLCGMGYVYDFKLRKRFVIDQFANTVQFVTTSKNPQVNNECLQRIVSDVRSGIPNIKRFDKYSSPGTSEQLEPFKVLTEPVTVVVLTNKFKALIVLACGLGAVGIWLFGQYLHEFIKAVIARYVKASFG